MESYLIYEANASRVDDGFMKFQNFVHFGLSPLEPIREFVK